MYFSFNVRFDSIIMFRFLLCLIIILLSSESEAKHCKDNSVNRIKFSQKRIKTLCVVKNKSLTIILEDAQAKHAWCSDALSTTNDFNFFYKEDNITTKDITISIPQVTDDMSTTWKCLILRRYIAGPPYPYGGFNYSAFEIKIYVHVKGAKPVKFNVNDLDIMMNYTSSDGYYDGEAQYPYEDGEYVNLICKPGFIKHGHNLRSLINNNLRLQYYDGNDKPLFETFKLYEAVFISRLRSNRNNSYIVCVYESHNSQEEYKYKMTFIQKKPDLNDKQETILIAVNDTNLVPLPQKPDGKEKYMIKYQYRYIEGDILKITCGTNVTPSSSLKFYFPGDANITATKDPSGSIHIMLSTKYLPNKVTCEINNTDRQVVSAELKLVPTFREFGMSLIGLPHKNMEYQYRNSDKQWHMVYRYSVNDTLRLFCVKMCLNGGNGEDLQFWFNGKNVEAKPEFSTDSMKWYIEGEFTLDVNHNGSEIVCNNKYDGNLVKVTLHLKPEPLIVEEEKDEKGNSVTKDTLVLILACSVGVMIIVVTATCVVCWCTRIKNARVIEDSYENLSNQNDSQIPAFPSQWENYYEGIQYNIYQDQMTRVNSLYLDGTGKNNVTTQQRQNNAPSESHYTEIDDYDKPKNDEISVTWNIAQPVIDKGEDVVKRQTSSLKQGTNNSYGVFPQRSNVYDRLRRSEIAVDNDRQGIDSNSYGNVPQVNKDRSVQFRQNSSANCRLNNQSNCLKPEYSNISIGNYSQGHRQNIQNTNIYSNVQLATDYEEAPRYSQAKHKKDIY